MKMSDVFTLPNNYRFLIQNSSILDKSQQSHICFLLYNRISLRTPKRIISNNISETYLDYAGYLSERGAAEIGTIVEQMFQYKWKSYINSIKETQYKDALNPFSITFTENKTGVLSSKDSGTRQSTSTGTDKTLTSKENTIERVRPFNQDTPSQRSNTEVTFTDDNQNTGESSTTNSNDYSRNETETRQTSRKGNIGNHTIPQLLTEMNNFLSFNFIEMIISDLTDLICKSVYD